MWYVLLAIAVFGLMAVTRAFLPARELPPHSAPIAPMQRLIKLNSNAAGWPAHRS